MDADALKATINSSCLCRLQASFMDADLNLAGIARRAVEDGLFDLQAAKQAQLCAHRQGKGLVSYLVDENLVSAQDIAMSVGQGLGMPLLDLDMVTEESILLATSGIDANIMRQHLVLPLARDGSIVLVAVADPANPGLKAIESQGSVKTETIIVEYDKLQPIIARVLEKTSRLDQAAVALRRLESRQPQNAPSAADTASATINQMPVVRFIDDLLMTAIQSDASDIHFEPYEKSYRVRLRIDGILYESAKPPAGLDKRIASRLKVMANLDIAERRIPQDGRIRIHPAAAEPVDFRINTLPTLWGEKVVLRLFNSNVNGIDIDELGLDAAQKAAYLAALKQPQGMILVTGPTGSGKTVTLYAGLNVLNTPAVNIATVEDPVEINLTGINQVPVNPKAGLDFAAALQAFLRQDPDILMVGEIRDPETADIAVKAAQTGHRLLSTLHTNRATETLTRLKNLGVSGFNLATSLSLIVAQRLARRLCQHCKRRQCLPQQALLAEGVAQPETGNSEVFEPQGCSHCMDGYKGRTGIYEMLVITPALASLIMAGANTSELLRQATSEGFVGLRQSAITKVKEGLTSLAEINRIIY